MSNIRLKDFDIDIQSRMKLMIKLANEKWPNRCWHTNATFWNDTDYTLHLVSSWGDVRNGVHYHKSKNKFTYTTEELQKIIKTSMWIYIDEEDIKR